MYWKITGLCFGFAVYCPTVCSIYSDLIFIIYSLQKQEELDPVIRIIKGPIVSEVSVFRRHVQHVVRVHSSPGFIFIITCHPRCSNILIPILPKV